MWISILIVFLALLCISLVQVLIFAINNQGKINVFTSDVRNEETKQKEETIDLSQIKDLELKFSGSELKVIWTDEPNLKIVQYATRKLESNEYFRKEQTNSKCTISEGKINWRFLFFNFNRICYDVYIPRSYQQNLSITTVSSNIQAEADITLQEFQLKATSGDIKIPGTITAQKLTIDAVSGNVILGKVDAKEVKIKTISGDVKVEEVQNVEAKTTSGKIEMGTVKQKADLESISGKITINHFAMTEDSSCKTTSGNIKIGVGQDINCQIRTKTVSGKVQLPDDRNVLGNEPYTNLRLESISGNLRVEQE